MSNNQTIALVAAQAEYLIRLSPTEVLALYYQRKMAGEGSEAYLVRPTATEARCWLLDDYVRALETKEE